MNAASELDRLHFEDFLVGEVTTYGRRTVTTDDIIGFASEYDPQPFHLDAEAARETMLDGLAASGWHSCAILMRMNVDGFLNRAAALGAPGIDRVRWIRPLRPDDTVSVRRTVLEARASRSHPEMGLVRFLFELIGADGSVVMTQEGPVMFERRKAM